MKYRYSHLGVATTLVILFVITFYQLVPLFKILREWQRGMKDVPFTKDIHYSNDAEYLIPPIIHQIWKDANVSTYPITPSTHDWISKFPNYTVKLWTEDMIVKLIKENYYWLWKTYSSYPHNIQRADVARYVVLEHEGGIYVDLDGFPQCASLFEKLAPVDHLQIAKCYMQFVNDIHDQ